MPLCRTVWASGVCCVLCAAFIFAIAALLVKLTGGRVPVLEITLIRSGISLVASAGKSQAGSSILAAAAAGAAHIHRALHPPQHVHKLSGSAILHLDPHTVAAFKRQQAAGVFEWLVRCAAAGVPCSSDQRQGHHSCDGAHSKHQVAHTPWYLW
jgi:hypothetical protein